MRNTITIFCMKTHERMIVLRVTIVVKLVSD